MQFIKHGKRIHSNRGYHYYHLYTIFAEYLQKTSWQKLEVFSIIVFNHPVNKWLHKNYILNYVLHGILNYCDPSD